MRFPLNDEERQLAAFPDPSLDGLPYTVAIWSDPNGDGDPTDAHLLTTASGVVSAQGTDTFLTTNISATITTPNFFVGFLITHFGGQFPSAFDETNPTFSNRSYVAGGAQGNIMDLTMNDLPVAPIEIYGLIGNWLVRADAGGGGALTFDSAFSEKGPWDIGLPLTGTGIEDRSGGANKKYAIYFVFNNTLASVASATTTCGSVARFSVDADDAHQVEVDLVGVNCNESEMTVTVNGVTDDQGNTVASASVTFGLLIGDVNGDGVVDRRDRKVVKGNLGQPDNDTNFRSDVATDGYINSADLMLVERQQGTSLP